MEIKHGITGNLYAYSKNKKEVRWACLLIGKSTNSIYYNKKYGTYAIRVKRKDHKRMLQQIAKNELFKHRDLIDENTKSRRYRKN